MRAPVAPEVFTVGATEAALHAVDDPGEVRDMASASRFAFWLVAIRYSGRNKGTVRTYPAITPRRVYQTERSYTGAPARAPKGAK